MSSHSRTSMPLTWTDLDRRAVDTVRVLAMDAVERAGHGHPGTAMALAERLQVPHRQAVTGQVQLNVEGQAGVPAGQHEPIGPVGISRVVPKVSLEQEIGRGRLVAPHTVNTMPEATLDAVLDHGAVRGDTVRGTYLEAWQVLDDLVMRGIDYDDVVTVLEQEGSRSSKPRGRSCSTPSTASSNDCVERAEAMSGDRIPRC